MKEHFKGVIWPRTPFLGKTKQGEKTIHRYIIVGMLVTDEPIDKFEGKNELFCDGATQGMAIPFETVRKRKPKYTVGNATSVLLNLNSL